MDISKLLLWGVAGFILLDLWSGSEPVRHVTASDAEVATTEVAPASELSLPPYPELSTVTYEDEYEDDNYEVESNLGREGIYESYATYEYVRPRDMGTENTYTFRVEGEDRYGDTVRGMVNTRGTYGSGYVRTRNGEHLWIETEWTDDGVLLGYNKDGTCYELETDEVR